MLTEKLFSEKLSLAGLACHNSLACRQPPAMVLIKKNGEEIEYSWFKYKEKVLQTVEGLKGRNLKAGETVAVIGLNLPETFFILLGAIFLGAVPVSINIMLLKEPNQNELKNILSDCRPGLVLTNAFLKKMAPEYCITFEQIIAEGKEALSGRPYGKNVNSVPLRIEIPLNSRTPQDTLIISYTNGAEEKPKSVTLNEESIFNRISVIAQELQLGNQEKILSFLPLNGLSELIWTFLGQIHGGYTVYFSEDLPVLQTLRQAKPTVFFGSPEVWKDLRKEMVGFLGIKKIPSWFKKIKTLNRILIKLVRKHLGFHATRIFIGTDAPIQQEELDFFQDLEINIFDLYLDELEKIVKKIEGVEEVIITGEEKPYLTALIFYDPNLNLFTKTLLNIQQGLSQIGESGSQVKKFRLLDKKELIWTTAAQVNKKAVIAKFKEIIHKMRENSR